MSSFPSPYFKVMLYFYSILFDCFRPSVKLLLSSIPAWRYATFHMHVDYSLLKRWILNRACGLVLIYTSLFAGFQILRVRAKRFCIPFRPSALRGATSVPVGNFKIRAKIPEWSRKYSNYFQILPWVAHSVKTVFSVSNILTLLQMILGSRPDQRYSRRVDGRIYIWNWRDLCEVILFWSQVKWSELRWSSWGQKYHVH